MTDIVASQLPPGAGRFQDFIYPDPIASAVATSAQHRGRYNSALAMPGTQVGGGSTIVTDIQQMPSQQLASNVGTPIQKLFYPGFPIMLRTSRSLISQYVDDCSVYRFVVIMAGTGVASAGVTDFGFEIVLWRGAQLTRIGGDGVPGIGIRLSTANVIEFLVSGPNGLIRQSITAAPFNTNLEFHSFDLRLFSATPTDDARLTLRIDGAPVPLLAVNSNWGAVGSNLPPMALGAAGLVGFVPSIVASSNQANNLLVQQVHMIAAPSELMTL